MVTLIYIYGPYTESPVSWVLSVCSRELHNDSFMLVGDFNLALNSVIDTNNYNSINNPKAREKLLESIDDINLFNYFKILNPGKKVITWSKKKPWKQGRLDYIMISESFSNFVESYILKPGYISNHVIVELKFSSFKRGHWLWKFNNSLPLNK